MVVVLIIGILVAIAIPVFSAAKYRAQLRTCFANQRSIESAAAMWLVDSTQPISVLAGQVNATHRLINPTFLLKPPSCPTAPNAAAGLYSVDSSGNVLACTFGTPTHGSFAGR